MIITQTNGNKRNNISGSRITIRTDDGEMVDQFEVPTRWGRKYCEEHPNGQYGQRYQRAIATCRELEGDDGARFV